MSNCTAQVDPDLATEQAATLQEALASDLLGSEEDPFLDILGTQSRAQIQVQETIASLLNMFYSFITRCKKKKKEFSNHLDCYKKM